MSLQVAAAFAITSLAGVLMMMYAVSARLLERRSTRCPTCGGVRSRTCTCDRD